MRSPKPWLSDLGLGVRLAVGGGRTSAARLVLGAVGIAIAVAVLLVAASIGNMQDQREVRAHAGIPVTGPISGVDPVYLADSSLEFRGETVDVRYVHATGPDSPVPPGLRELPDDGELVVSPALRELLSSPDGALLRPRLPGEITGELGQIAVVEPDALVAYVGEGEEAAGSDRMSEIYGFGLPPSPTNLAPFLLVMGLVGVVALLVPVFIFVSTSSRIAGAERDRRLSALRLVGSGARQVRRIAAAESLVSALAGLVLGGGLFLVARQYAEEVNLFGIRVYVSDVVPSPVLTALVVVAVPLLSVLTTQFALRRTVIEPLGVVRLTKPVRRRVWWRLALLVVGVVLLVTQAGTSRNTLEWALVVSTGAALLLIGVPVLLPWLVERISGRLRGGPASWQLAIRRLQLDSGTSARVVGGVAVVLSGAIALQTLLLSAEHDVRLAEATQQEPPKPMLDVMADESITGEVAAKLAAAPGVRSATEVRYEAAATPGSDTLVNILVMDCAGVRALTGEKECADGQAFRVAQDPRAAGPRPDAVEAGETLEFRAYAQDADADPNEYDVVGTWTVPAEPRDVRLVLGSGLYGELIATPGALGGVSPGPSNTSVVAVLADVSSDELEVIRNSVAEYSWRIAIRSSNTQQDLTRDQSMFMTIRSALFAGSIFTLVLAGVSLLVLALEHIRERRRPLAILAASGVPRAVLGRSLLWQVVLPIALGVAVAAAAGLLLAWLVIDRVVEASVVVDWSGVGILAVLALLLGVLVTAATLPFLRSATRLAALRAE